MACDADLDFDGGSYRPVAALPSLDEAREIAGSDMCGRMKELERGEAGCPELFVIGEQGAGGSYRQVREIIL